MKTRLLTPTEIRIARTVFSNKIPYDRIYVSDISEGAVTVGDMCVGVRNGKPFSGSIYCICWREAFNNPAGSLQIQSVLIHELTHVWQGEHGVYPAVYMAQSIYSQLEFGIRDIIRSRGWRGWGNHRSTAYEVSPSEIGQNWSYFNVEQQAAIVQSWYTSAAVWSGLYGSSIQGGNASTNDSRYPYIKDVILTGNRGAAYVRPPAPVVVQSSTLAPGGDREIKKLQDRLVQLGYLNPSQADGLVGRTRSATLDAVAEFQRNNNLKVDRDLGGPNSETRRKLLSNAKLVPKR